MPHIEEKYLLELHKIIDESNDERDEFEMVFHNQLIKNKVLKNQRNLLISLSTISLLFLLTLIALYLLNPNLFIQKRYLKANGLTLVKQEVLKENTTKLDTPNYELAHTIVKEETLVSTIEDVLLDKMIYVVQIAASDVELTSIFHRGLQGLTESYEEDQYKYIIGNFEMLSQAQDYRKELLKIGFEDAFIASYINSERQKIEDAW